MSASSTLLLFALFAFASAQAPAFCGGRQCPAFTKLQTGRDYEVRKYGTTTWIACDSKTIMGMMSCFPTLHSTMKDAGITLAMPVLSYPHFKNNNMNDIEKYTMLFYVPGNGLSKIRPVLAKKRNGVRIETLAPMTVFVRSFTGYATEGKWRDEQNKLATDLRSEGKSFTRPYGASYNTPWQLAGRHNEMWFVKSD